MPAVRRTRPLVNLALAGAAVALAAAPLAASLVPGGADLFVTGGGEGGELRAVAGRAGRFVLDLRGTEAVTSFTDRPSRAAGSESLAHFVSRWRARGFVADPPNAALEIPGAPRGRDVVILELTRPRLTGRGAVRFQARRVGAVSQGLTRFSGRRDARTRPSFGRWSLFVDPGAPTGVPIGISVGMPGGSTVSVALGGSAVVSEMSLLVSGNVGLFTGNLLTTDRGLQVTSDQALGFVASFLVAGTSGSTLTGTAVVPAGAQITATGPVGPVNITNGAFSIPLS